MPIKVMIMPCESTGGHTQWSPVDGPDEDLMMLTSDMALKSDQEYYQIVLRYANNSNMDEFKHQFAHAWYKLTTRDMGPSWRCLWGDPLPPQDFQLPLPAPVVDENLNYEEVRAEVIRVLNTENKIILPFDNSKSYGPLFVRMAWQCFNTFRATDYIGKNCLLIS
jgi:catalase-peroxidase